MYFKEVVVVTGVVVVIEVVVVTEVVFIAEVMVIQGIVLDFSKAQFIKLCEIH
jgi:hypothetical protein